MEHGEINTRINKPPLFCAVYIYALSVATPTTPFYRWALDKSDVSDLAKGSLNSNGSPMKHKFAGIYIYNFFYFIDELENDCCIESVLKLMIHTIKKIHVYHTTPYHRCFIFSVRP